jgi:hypothetical protein
MSAYPLVLDRKHNMHSVCKRRHNLHTICEIKHNLHLITYIKFIQKLNIQRLSHSPREKDSGHWSGQRWTPSSQSRWFHPGWIQRQSGCCHRQRWWVSVKEPSKRSEKSMIWHSYLARQLSVFSKLTNNRVYKIMWFQFQCGLTNKWTHKSLSWFSPLPEGNSPTSSGLILSKKISVIRGEQSARIVCVLKGVWISCLLPEG